MLKGAVQAVLDVIVVYYAGSVYKLIISGAWIQWPTIENLYGYIGIGAIVSCTIVGVLLVQNIVTALKSRRCGAGTKEKGKTSDTSCTRSNNIPGSSSQDSIVVAKRWVREQLVGITIEDWDDPKRKTRDDGKSVVIGHCEGQSWGVVAPPRYRFQVVLTNSNDVVPNESWVRKTRW